MPNTRTSASNRKLKNFAIAPTKQFKVALFTVGFGLVLFIGFFAFELWIMTSVAKNLLGQIPDPSLVEQMLAESIQWSWLAFAAVAVLFAMVVGASVFVITHRFYGPEVAIRKHVEALTRGDYDHRTHLRKSDEFKEVASHLNTLSDRLQGKNLGNAESTVTAPR